MSTCNCPKCSKLRNKIENDTHKSKQNCNPYVNKIDCTPFLKPTVCEPCPDPIVCEPCDPPVECPPTDTPDNNTCCACKLIRIPLGSILQGEQGPQGIPGPQGAQGPQGIPGAPPTLTVSVSTLTPGSSATVNITEV